VTERRYGGAGLTIVADRAIPGLGCADPGASADLTIYAGQVPFFGSAPHVSLDSGDRGRHGAQQVVASRNCYGYRFEYVDGTRFWIDVAGERIWMTWCTTFEDACTYLIGPMMAFVLRLRGDVVLHASAVKVGDSAMAFVGPHGSGKSTTAAALARAGCPVITDDLLRLTAEPTGWLAHPYGSALRLWPTSAALLYGDPERLPRITESWDKRGLALEAEGEAAPAAGPIPLGRVVFLSRAPAAAPAFETRPVHGAGGILSLIANSSGGHLLDAHARAHEFRAIARLAGEVACVAVNVGDGAEPLDRLTRYLLA
jgi:hypothetical protein